MEDILICQDTWEGKGKVAYTVVASVAQFFLPVLLVIMLYLSIYLKLKNRPQVRFFKSPLFPAFSVLFNSFGFSKLR